MLHVWLVPQGYTDQKEISAYVSTYIISSIRALAGVAQWIECQPVNQGVAGSTLSQDTCLGCGPSPQ